MAYGLAYFGEFWDHDGGSNRVEIRYINKVDDAGSHRMALAQKPVVSELPAADRFSVINGKGLTVTVSNSLVEGPLFYIPMFGGAETDWRVELFVDTVRVFTGYVIPSLYADSIGPLPHIIQITAADGLGRLPNQYYLGPSGFGAVKLLTMIEGCLAFTGSALRIDIGCRVFSYTHSPIPTRTLFDQSYVSKEILISAAGNYRSAEEALIACLKIFMCRISQGVAPDGELVWLIERIPEMQENNMHFVSYLNDVYVKDYDRPKTQTTLSYGNAPLLLGENSLSYQPAYKDIEITVDLTRYPSLVFSGSLITPVDSYPSGSNFTLLPPPNREWSKHDTVIVLSQLGIPGVGIYSPNTLFYMDTESDYQVNNPPATTGQFDGLWTSTSFSFVQNTNQLTINVTAVFSEGQVNFFKAMNLIQVFEVYITQKRPNTPKGFPVENWVGTAQGNWRFTLNPTGSPVDNAESYARIMDVYTFPDDNTDYGARTNREATFGITIPLDELLDTFGEYSAIIKMVPMRYGDNMDSNDLDDSFVTGELYAIDKFDVEVINTEQDNVFIATIDESNIETYRESFLINETANINYKNALIDLGFVRLIGWAENSTDPFKALVELYLIKIFQTFARPRFSLVAKVRSGLPGFSDLFYEPEFTGKVFYQVGNQHNYHRAITEVSLSEHIVYDNVDIDRSYNFFQQNNVGDGATFLEGFARIVIDATGRGTSYGNVLKYINKWYFEVTVISGQGLIGLGQILCNRKNEFFETPYLGENPYGIGLYGADGSIRYNGGITAGTGTFVPGNIVGVSVDFETQTIQWFVNGVLKNTHTLPALQNIAPAASTFNIANTADFRFNSGETPFTYPPPARFNPGWFYTLQI